MTDTDNSNSNSAQPSQSQPPSSSQLISSGASSTSTILTIRDIEQLQSANVSTDTVSISTNNSVSATDESNSTFSDLKARETASNKPSNNSDSDDCGHQESEETDTEIILVRHGETEWNVTHTLQGTLDSSLTANGIRGAILVGQKLQKLHMHDRQISKIYVSPLGRAQHTLKLICEQFQIQTQTQTQTQSEVDGGIEAMSNGIGIPIEVDVRLQERCFGDFQGRTWASIMESDPVLSRQLWNDLESKPPGQNAQSFLDLHRKVVECFAEIVQQNIGKRVLIVSHGGAIQVLLSDILHNLQYLERSFYVKNCAINIIKKERKNGRWFCSVLGDDNYSFNMNINHNNNNNTIFRNPSQTRTETDTNSHQLMNHPHTDGPQQQPPQRQHGNDGENEKGNDSQIRIPIIPIVVSFLIGYGISTVLSLRKRK